MTNGTKKLTYNPKKVARILRETAGILKDETWTKGSYFKLNPNTCACAHGGLQYVGNPKVKATGFRLGEKTTPLWRPPAQPWEALAAVRAAGWGLGSLCVVPTHVSLKDLYAAHFFAAKEGLTFEFNDAPGTTLAMVKEKLLSAAEKIDPVVKKKTGKTFSSTYQPTAEQRQKAMGRVYARRLLKLADLVEKKEAAGRFKFSRWVGDDYAGNADLSCGTSACALGWATTMPELRRLGLRLVTPHCSAAGAYAYSQPLLIDHPSLGPAEAAVRLFGLTVNEHYYMFTPQGGGCGGGRGAGYGLRGLPKDATGSMVADNMRMYVSHKYPDHYKAYMAASLTPKEKVA